MTLSIHSLEEFAQKISPPARLAALDIGTKTIGLAVSTPDWGMITPLTTLTRAKWAMDMAALEKTFALHAIDGLIVGLPHNMDGSEGPRAQGVRQVVYNLIKANPVWLNGPIAFVDESMSSAAAEEFTGHHKNNRKAKASGALDAIAAQVILNRAITHIQRYHHDR